MNNTIRLIKERRTLRDFSKKEISRDIINEIIECGNNAPTGANAQPFRFVVIKNTEEITTLARKSKAVYSNWIDSAPEILKNARKIFDEKYEDSMLYNAPLVIFIIGKKIVSYDKDCPMVALNMMTAAYSLGIGSCWSAFGSFGVDSEFKEKMKMEEDEVIFGPILFGYPEEEFPEKTRKRDALILEI